MKRLWKKAAVIVSGATLAAVAGLPFPGCGSMVFDPAGFLQANACNIFNCDTLFFLRPSEVVDGQHEDEEGEDHTHE